MKSFENISVTVTQGHRQYMEDTFIVDDIVKRNGKNIKILSVFDGHGGKMVSDFCQKEFVNILKKNLLRFPEIDVCLRRTYSEIDARCYAIGMHCGSTSVTILRRENELWIANCGDSEAMMGYKNGVYKVLTERHKVEDEKERLQKLGANITYDDGCARINRMLNLARAFGDYHLKKYVVSTPYVRCTKVSTNADYLIIASDGLWDVYDYETLDKEIKNLKQNLKNEGYDIKKMTDTISYEITRRAILRGSTDNISVILYLL